MTQRRLQKPQGYRTARCLQRLVKVKPEETSALLWSFLYFFSLLCSYYILRPLRDEMGISAGIEHLQWVFTGTFIAMLVAVPIFGYVATRMPIRRLLPVVYGFFILNILIFFVLLQINVSQTAVSQAFFIWTSVFNLFVVSIFWSFMADLFSNAQARRLFGFIAAGGSAGAIAGPSLTTMLVGIVGPVNLLLISAAWLTTAVLCIRRLTRWNRPLPQGNMDTNAPRLVDAPGSRSMQRRDVPLGGSILDGIRLVLYSPYLLGICLFIWFYTNLSTFLYFEQAHIVSNAFQDPAERTALFASIDLLVNVLTIGLQLFLTGRIIARVGLPITLALLPFLMACGFVGLGLAPILPVLILFQVIRRAGNYALARPAREVLYTVVAREAKYKAKNFIDTVVYRAGDAISSWLFAGLKGIGLSLSSMAFLAVPIAVLCLCTGLLLGRKQEELRVTKPHES
jgi:AAA family ATP:ADP antiporter